MAATTSLEKITLRVDLFADLVNAIDSTNVRTLAKKMGVEYRPSVALTSGTTANKANRLLFLDDYTLAVGAPLSLQMKTGANWDGVVDGEDALGNAIAIVEIVACAIWCRPESGIDTQVKIGGGGSADAWKVPFDNSLTLKNVIYNDGLWLVHSGATDPAYQVGTTDNMTLRVEAFTSNARITAIALGRSA